MLTILGTFVFFAVFGLSKAALADEYQENERLDAQNASDYMLYWTYNKADSTISFAAKAKTNLGWIGLGFTTKIDNTTTYDVVRGSYDDFTKRGEIYDFHAVGENSPVNDTQQNLIEKSVAKNGSYTTIKFKRALDTGDSNDTVIKPGPMIVVWSIGKIEQLGSGYKGIGYITVTFIPEDQKNVSTTATPTTKHTVSKAVACRDSWLSLALSALLFMAPVLRP